MPERLLPWEVSRGGGAWYYMVGGGPRAAVFVAVTVVTTWGGAMLMDGISSGEESRFRKSQNLGAEKLSRDQKRILKAAVQKKKRRIMVLVLLLNFGILGVVKYGNFVTTNINSLFEHFHTGTSIPVADFLLPLGISFYTFQSMGYLIDVYRGKYSAERKRSAPWTATGRPA